MENILEVKGICKTYGNFSLKEVSFDVPKGFICGFIGPNGAGKTTTLKSILGIVKPDSGEIKIFGSNETIANNEKVGVVMDSPMYVDEWKISDVSTALSPFYRNWDENLFDKYLKQFELEKKKKVKDLSRGMKVKLQIAAALSHDAELLILDEPTSGLDPVARDEICDLLREFVSNEKNSVIFSTHITSDLEKTADYIVFILGGKIVFTGEKDRLLEKYVRVTGGMNEVTSEQKKLLIGFREHVTGFEAMTETENLRKLPKTLFKEKINLDEIIIFINKENKK
jgi:ABC-2 type transport system ATP-binding protein